MGERIYIMSGEGLEPMEEEPFDLEDTLQALIAEHPELIDGEQVRPGDPRRWILVKREQGIAETAGAGALWAVDLLLIDQDAMPTLVEVKRGSNSEIRRTVVGQMLEYAAHARRNWTVNEIRQNFEATETNHGRDTDETLRELLGLEENRDEEEEPEDDALGERVDDFWDRVATNLAASRLRLLFVADEVPDPLAQVVEFLNEQMPSVEVMAVEIKQFRGRSSQTLVPRVIGRTAGGPSKSTAGPKQKMTRELFMEQLPTGEARTAAEQLFDVARDNRATFEWGSVGVSVRCKCSLWNQPVTVAWFSPPNKLGWMRTKNFSFGAALFDLEGYDPQPPERLISLLEQWANQFRDEIFAQDVSSSGVRAWAIHPDDMVNHVDLLAERLERVLSDLRAL